MSYLTRAGTVLSQAANALIFNGHPDMSLSTRAFLNRETPFWSYVYGLAEAVFGDGHCEESLESDLRYAADIERMARGEK